MRKLCRTHFYLFLLAILPTWNAIAEVTVSDQIFGRVETFSIESNETGDQHPISVYLPPGYDKSAESYPILVLLDSNLLFGAAQTAVNLYTMEGSIHPPIVVGVGYPEDQFESFMKLRMRYFASAAESDRNGAEAFSRFLRKELIPEVIEKYRTEQTRIGLFAAALPGLFAAYELFSPATPFNSFILCGPRLWWNDGAFFDYETNYSLEHKTLSARVFTTVGLQDDIKYRRSWNRFVDTLNAHSYRDFTLETRTIKEAGHFGAIPDSLNDGIRAIYQK